MKLDRLVQMSGGMQVVPQVETDAEFIGQLEAGTAFTATGTVAGPPLRRNSRAP